MCPVVRNGSKQNEIARQEKEGNPVSAEKPAPALAPRIRSLLADTVSAQGSSGGGPSDGHARSGSAFASSLRAKRQQSELMNTALQPGSARKTGRARLASAMGRTIKASALGQTRKASCLANRSG